MMHWALRQKPGIAAAATKLLSTATLPAAEMLMHEGRATTCPIVVLGHRLIALLAEQRSNQPIRFERGFSNLATGGQPNSKNTPKKRKSVQKTTKGPIGEGLRVILRVADRLLDCQPGNTCVQC